MLKTMIKASIIMLLFGFLSSSQVFARTGITAGAFNFTRDIGLWQSSLSEPLSFSIKRGEPYDEKKDPALRRGSENSEEPQNSFFLIPIVMFVGMGLFLYYNKL